MTRASKIMSAVLIEVKLRQWTNKPASTSFCEHIGTLQVITYRSYRAVIPFAHFSPQLGCLVVVSFMRDLLVRGCNARLQRQDANVCSSLSLFWDAYKQHPLFLHVASFRKSTNWRPVCVRLSTHTMLSFWNMVKT